MTPQSDGLVTKEDIQELDKLALMIHVNDRGIYLGDALMLCQKLLAERDAYREVAIQLSKEWCQENGDSCDGVPEFVDAEARRILEEKKPTR